MSAGAARLARLVVHDFRNLEDVDLSPPAAGWVVVGENGQGKTNLLEAIHYLQLLRSARGARDADVVRFGAEAFHISAQVDTGQCHEVSIGFERAGHRKRARLDGAVPERLSDALGALPSVMFSPDDVALVTGSPAERRRFLDVMLAVTSHAYLVALQQYRAALLRRNAALRSAAASMARAHGESGAVDAVAVWEPALAEHGAALWRERRAWVAAMEDRFESLCHEIGEQARVRMRYASTLASVSDDPRSALARSLEEKRISDLRRGITQVGPHRDDLVVTLEGRDLRVFGSAGQQRTAAIALRMLEAATVTERRGLAPLLLLDDPFAELDARRSTHILSLLEREGMGQTVLAVPRESDIPAALTRLVRFHIAGGVVTRDDA